MGYRRMDMHVLKAILRRWIDGQSINRIHREEGFDRKTIRGYIAALQARGLEPGGRIDEEEFDRVLSELLPSNRRVRKKRELLEPYREEIVQLVNPDRGDDADAHRREEQTAEAVKPKTAWLILREKYDLSVSYETFKLYAREIGLEAKSSRAPIRLETPPGQEIQIDYGTVGSWYERETGKERRVYAFAAKLSCSRLPFIRFVFTQKQESWVENNIEMVEFYDGVTECLLIDNLKSGVLKADVWDPQINRVYAEFAEYYGTFIDTARVRKATDKAKVERLIPQARELFRRLKAVHPTASLTELNEAALRWCRQEYGQAVHGTTGIAPIRLYEEQERARLKPLPPVRFEMPTYKPVKVHPDRFFTFEHKRYAMPENYRGCSLIARHSGGMLKVFDASYRLLRTYLVTERRVTWLPGDFPESQEALMQGTYPRYLLGRARGLGREAELLVAALLSPHAWVRARLAKGMLAVLERYRREPYFAEICAKALDRRIFNPKQLSLLFDEEQKQQRFPFVPPLSQSGRAMTRNIREYLN
jgi:transposase